MRLIQTDLLSQENNVFWPQPTIKICIGQTTN